ncbi:hypothetical protein ILT44_05520 [Microvirga sp. BT689]|uniref:hypothetical protein n=1 Tax=Microvirga arvi TaxID=2778731 RepID=UPI001950288D|nr:hypothetical protein [Microvirga arvi]MBM6579633.1 hypothetical protein [Microvirga arvi]
MGLSISQEREWRAVRQALARAQFELRHLRLSLSLKRFNPSQPRVPAGHSDGGQWTDGGGGGHPRATFVSARSRGGGTRNIGGRNYATTPAQEVRLDVAAARARALTREVQRHDPNWRPTPSMYEGVEGAILASESQALQAAARLRELQRREPVSGPMEEIFQPNGQHVGIRHRGTDERTRTVTPSEFNNLLESLTPGSQIVQSPLGYRGFWYRRPDGSIFGVRRSERNGVTVDVIQNNHPDIRNGYKVHQK